MTTTTASKAKIERKSEGLSAPCQSNAQAHGTVKYSPIYCHLLRRVKSTAGDARYAAFEALREIESKPSKWPSSYWGALDAIVAREQRREGVGQ